ncbi:hypothetical protein ADK97_21310 [Streptomyces sp. H021]|nr:hypothetical protein ADK97_21310 [Streptomyces sp. H021]
MRAAIASMLRSVVCSSREIRSRRTVSTSALHVVPCSSRRRWRVRGLSAIRRATVARAGPASSWTEARAPRNRSSQSRSGTAVARVWSACRRSTADSPGWACGAGAVRSAVRKVRELTGASNSMLRVP